MADYTVQLIEDAENKKLFGKVVDSAGADVTTWGSFELVLGQDPGGTPGANPGHAMGLAIKFRETVGCDDAGDPQYCMMLRSAWYATAKTSNPEA